MRKIVSIIAGILAFSAAAYADNDRAVSFDRLPEKARDFITGHFHDAKLAYARQERDFMEVHYEVVLVQGVKLEFDRWGNWTEVECRYACLDADLIPGKIRDYVSNAYPGTEYRKISKEGRNYEVKLDNGLELLFDRNMSLMGIDD